MVEWFEVYGGLPKNLGKVDVDSDQAEFCFVQYLPIKFPFIAIAIPDNLKWVVPLVDLALNSEYCNGKYMYLTVKKMYGSGNREGWHTDGFGTDDTNLIWYDKSPTQFDHGVFYLNRCHEKSIEQMEYQHKEENIIEYPNKTLLLLDQGIVHRVNPKPFEGFRTFVKISISDSKYNLKGNAHNYLLDYNWKMKDRSMDRNHPIGE